MKVLQTPEHSPWELSAHLHRTSSPSTSITITVKCDVCVEVWIQAEMRLSVDSWAIATLQN